MAAGDHGERGRGRRRRRRRPPRAARHVPFVEPDNRGFGLVAVEGASRHDPSRLRGRTTHNKVVNFDGLAGAGEIVAVEITAATSQTLSGTASLLGKIGSLTEYPGARVVFGVSASSLGL